MLTLITVLIGAAAMFAAAAYLAVQMRAYHRADRADQLTIMHAQNLSGHNGHDPSIRAIIDSVGDEADDTFGPDSFR